MHAHWLEWLQQPGIQLSDDQVSEVPPHDRTTSMVPLTDAGIITVNGPDAQRFLQGQLSCDLDDVDQHGSLPGAHCNIKGHMHSLYQVIHAGNETYWLRTRTSMAPEALTLLKKYIIFSKAEATLNEELVGIGLLGEGAPALADQLAAIASTSAQVKHHGGMVEFWFDVDTFQKVMALASQTAGLGCHNDWELAAVEAGIPDLFPATREAFIPQMVNLQVFEGVSFTKGCYTGQEIVTRLQHRGQLKRPMYLAQLDSNQPPLPGTRLASESKDNVGQIVRSAQGSDGRYQVLAVIVKDQAEQHSIHLDTAAGPLLQLEQLPYVLDPRLFESKR